MYDSSGVGGHDHDRQRYARGARATDRGRFVRARLQIEQHHSRSAGGDGGEHLVSVEDLAHDLEIVAGFEDGAIAIYHQPVIFGDEDAGRHGGPPFKSSAGRNTQRLRRMSVAIPGELVLTVFLRRRGQRIVGSHSAIERRRRDPKPAAPLEILAAKRAASSLLKPPDHARCLVGGAPVGRMSWRIWRAARSAAAGFRSDGGFATGDGAALRSAAGHRAAHAAVDHGGLGARLAEGALTAHARRRVPAHSADGAADHSRADARQRLRGALGHHLGRGQARRAWRTARRRAWTGGAARPHPRRRRSAALAAAADSLSRKSFGREAGVGGRR